MDISETVASYQSNINIKNAIHNFGVVCYGNDVKWVKLISHNTLNDPGKCRLLDFVNIIHSDQTFFSNRKISEETFSHAWPPKICSLIQKFHSDRPVRYL